MKLSSILNYLSRLALCFWIGEMLFFAAIFAPKVFSILPRGDASRLQFSIFPAYFMVGILSGIPILVSILQKLKNSPKEHVKKLRWALFFCIFAWLIFFFSYAHVLPKLQELKLASDVQGFAFWHRLSTTSNGIALMALLVLLAVI